jgi:hypothetical protein
MASSILCSIRYVLYAALSEMLYQAIKCTLFKILRENFAFEDSASAGSPSFTGTGRAC